MMLIEETAVPPAALPLAEFKTHLRLGTGFTDDDIQDALLESFLRAAVSAIEARTGKILIERVFSWTLSVWRDVGGQSLPIAPVNAITRMTLRDRADEEEVIDAAPVRTPGVLAVRSAGSRGRRRSARPDTESHGSLARHLFLL